MTLNEYLTQNKIPNTQFADLIEVSPAAITYYRNEKRIPEKEIMQRIVTATNGQVTPNDFYNIANNSHSYPQESTPAIERA